MLRIGSFFLLLLLISTSLYCQVTSLKYNNTTKKLYSSNYIYDVVEDLNGYIWTASDEGVYRYNGTESILLTTKNGLPSNEIIYLNLDAKNRIWLTGFYNGLYFIEDKTVKKVAGSENISDLYYSFEKNDSVFFNDRKLKSSYYYYNGKLNKYQNQLLPDNKILDYYKQKNIKIEYDYYSIYINNKKEIEKSEGYLYYPNIHFGSPSFVKLKNSSNFPFISRVLPNSYLLFENNKLVKRKIDETLSETDTIFYFGKFQRKKHRVFLTSKNKIIVNTEGVFNYDLSSKLNNLNLNFKNFYLVYIDSKNNFWLIDKNNSLTFVDYNYDENPIVFDKNCFKNDLEYIKCFLKYKDNLLVTTNLNKIFVTNIYSQKTYLLKDYDTKILNSLFLVKDELQINLQDKIDIYNLKNERPKLVSTIPKAVKRSAIFNDEVYYTISTKLLDSNQNLIWENNKSENITSIGLDANTIYFATYSTIVSLNKINKTTKIKPFKNINCIAVSNTNIIASTNNGKIILFDKNLKIIDDVKVDDNFFSIKIDKYNNWIYLIGKKTISFFYINKNNKLELLKKINKYDDANFVNLDFDKNTIYLSTQNKIYKLLKNKQLQPIKAVLDIENVSIIGSNKNVKNKAVLKRNENNLNFEVSLKTYDNINYFDVSYSIIYNDKRLKKWEKISIENLNFNNLNPGEYVINFRVTPKFGNIQSTYTSFIFSIEYHFWEMLWFKIITIIAIILIILYIIISIKNRSLKKQKMIDKLIRLEQKALIAQMNPHFIFNALNSIQSSMLLEGERAANKHFVNFSRLLRTTLDILNTDKITIKEEIEYLKSYISIEQLNTKEPISAEIIIDENILVDQEKIPVMLLQPIVENAILHGFKKDKLNKKLKIEFIKNNNKTITICVEDNGSGIEDSLAKQKRHKSYATSILKKRLSILSKLEKVNYTIIINNLNRVNKSTETGTKVILIIPSKI